MIDEQLQATVFERGSNVLDYWLAHAEGFDVVARGKRRRRVDHVVVDRQLGSASVLVVRSKRGRRHRVIPVVAVSAVDPFERLLYLSPRRRPGADVARVRPHVVQAARTAHRAGHVAVDRLAPRAVLAARVTRRQSIRAALWLAPRLLETGRLVRLVSARAGDASRRAVTRLRPVLVEAARTTRRSVVLGLARMRPALGRLRNGIQAARKGGSEEQRPLLP